MLISFNTYNILKKYLKVASALTAQQVCLFHCIYLPCEVFEFIWGEYRNQSPEASSRALKQKILWDYIYVCFLNYTKSSVLLSIIFLAMHKIKYLGLDVNLYAFILIFNENIFFYTQANIFCLVYVNIIKGNIITLSSMLSEVTSLYLLITTYSLYKVELQWIAPIFCFHYFKLLRKQTFIVGKLYTFRHGNNLKLLQTLDLEKNCHFN